MCVCVCVCVGGGGGGGGGEHSSVHISFTDDIRVIHTYIDTEHFAH